MKIKKLNNVTLISGPKGCGKTEYIEENYTPDLCISSSLLGSKFIFGDTRSDDIIYIEHSHEDYDEKIKELVYAEEIVISCSKQNLEFAIRKPEIIVESINEIMV